MPDAPNSLLRRKALATCRVEENQKLPKTETGNQRIGEANFLFGIPSWRDAQGIDHIQTT